METKKHISYLPERTYLTSGRKVSELLSYFQDFYEDFDPEKALSMLDALQIDKNAAMKSLSKGTKEKVQLIFVMSRNADLYILDEPIAGVDPAARDYILKTIISNYNENASILLSTHLISDIEAVLDGRDLFKERTARAAVLGGGDPFPLRKIRGRLFQGGVRMLSRLIRHEWKETWRIPSFPF